MLTWDEEDKHSGEYPRTEQDLTQVDGKGESLSR